MSGAENPTGHFGAAELTVLHTKDLNGEEDGACLTAHEASYAKFKRKITCNYRHQAYRQAMDEPKIKNRLHRYKKLTKLPTRIPTLAYDTSRGLIFPDRYSWSLSAPEDGDWDLGGPTRASGSLTRRVQAEDKATKKLKSVSDTIPNGENFTTVTWPYWNNAHHIVPKSILFNCISALPAKTSDVMQKALLTAKYNLNHKLNMLMMPQDLRVAELLKLCRHLQLLRKTKGVKCSVADHPEYSRLVTAEVQEAVDHYKDICDEAIKNASPTSHKVPNAKLSKAKLVNISKRFLKKLLDWGEDEPGASMSKKALGL